MTGLFWHRINFEKGTVNLDGTDYPLLDTNFPTIDPKDPYKLSEEEEEIMERMERAFLAAEKLRRTYAFSACKGQPVQGL